MTQCALNEGVRAGEAQADLGVFAEQLREVSTLLGLSPTCHFHEIKDTLLLRKDEREHYLKGWKDANALHKEEVHLRLKWEGCAEALALEAFRVSKREYPKLAAAVAGFKKVESLTRRYHYLAGFKNKSSP